ncbi:MAG TPA: protein kinase [Terriglobales bacterium]|nr:protein kinase [Terriglobales bacterium]
MPAPQPAVGQSLGHYRIVEQIGAGGMGVVFRAHDQKLERDVAIKVLPARNLIDESSRSRFHKEALALAKLSHPNVAMAFEFGQEGEIDFLVTEYIPGQTLDAKLSGAGPLPQKDVVDLGIQLAKGLEAAHRVGIVHRDLKPGNLILSSDDTLKILDFGLAQLVGMEAQLAETISLGEAHFHAGTLPYMSPEQLRGEAADPRSDIWAAGAVLYEMATGCRTFPQTQPPLITDAILHDEPLRPTALNPTISPGLEAVIVKALDKDPDRRYQTARELRVDLVRLQPGGTMSSSGFTVPVPPRRKSKLGMMAVLLCVLVLGIGAGVLLRKYGQKTVARQRVLAVLPFDAVGQGTDTTALGVGLTETLTAKLAQLSESNALQLVSTRDIQAEGVKTADQALREFGTDLVLEGNVQQAGDQIRINCILVDPHTRRQIDARTITTAAHDVFDLEDRVVDEALNLLGVNVRPANRGDLLARRETQPTAYEHYLRARGYLEEYQRSENIDSAIGEFNKALLIDANYAPAYSGLGEAYWLGFQQANRPNDWVTKASEYCRKALSISVNFAEGHTCLGDVDFGTGNYDDAVKQFQLAVDLDQTSADAMRGLADAYHKQGNQAAAEETYKKAIATHPHSWGLYNALGDFYYRQGRYPDAEATFRHVTELFPDNPRGYSNLGGILMAEGRYGDSIATLQRSINLRPNIEAYTNLGFAYFALRRFADSAATFEQGLKLDNHDWLLWGNLGDALYWTPSRQKEASGAYQKAISLVESRLQVNPKDAMALAYLADYNAMLDKKATALQSLGKAITLAPADPDVRLRAALIFNHFSETDQCLSALRKATALGLPTSMIRDTPDFDHLRQSPEFQSLFQSH